MKPLEPLRPEDEPITHVAVGDVVGWSDRSLAEPRTLQEAYRLRGKVLEVGLAKLAHNDYRYPAVRVQWDDARWPTPLDISPPWRLQKRP